MLDQATIEIGRGQGHNIEEQELEIGCSHTLIEKQSSAIQNVHCNLSLYNSFSSVKSQGDKSQRTIQFIIQVARDNSSCNGHCCIGLYFY